MYLWERLRDYIFFHIPVRLLYVTICLANCYFSVSTFFLILYLGKEEIIYQKLKSAAEQTKTFKVYKREDIPKKYHYGNNTRVGPIFVIAEIGYAFQNLYDAIESYKQKFNITGNFVTCPHIYCYIHILKFFNVDPLFPFS